MKISEKGQITIPKELRDKYGLREDVELEFIQAKGGLFIQTREEARRARKPSMIKLAAERWEAYEKSGAPTIEEIMEQRRKDGLSPIEQVAGILDFLGPDFDNDLYADQVRGRCTCGRCIC